MPLIAIEYSKNTVLPDNIGAFLQALHSTVQSSIDTDLNSIKSWLSPHQNFLIGKQKEDAAAYMLINIQIMQGRTKDERKQLGENLLSHIKQVILPLNSTHDMQLRVKVDEIPLCDYFSYG